MHTQAHSAIARNNNNRDTMAFRMTVASAFAVFAFVQVAAARDLFQSDCEDDTCAGAFTKCGGRYFNVSTPCCDDTHSCVVKNYYYAQCLSETLAAENVANGWDGTILDCEEMPEDVLDGPMDMPEGRKLLDMDGGYGIDCDDDSCGLLHDKCGGGYNTSTPCCDPELSCVVKHWYYAQCLSEELAALNMVNHGWDGRVLMCEEMPDDVPKGPKWWDFNKTEADVEYVVSRKLQDMAGTDCEDDSCVDTFEKCGGTDFNSSVTCCDDDSMCVVKSYYYAQCLTAKEAEENIDIWGWDGRVLDCEEMPEDLMPEHMVDDGMDRSARRMLQVGSYGGYGMAYGSKGYGYGMISTADAPGPVMIDLTPMEPADAPVPTPAEADMPATAPVTPKTEIVESDLVLGDGCSKCAPIFGQCADKGDIVSCCGEGLECTKKHGYYAQCLPPARAARNVENFGWDGSIMECGSVML